MSMVNMLHEQQVPTIACSKLMGACCEACKPREDLACTQIA